MRLLTGLIAIGMLTTGVAVAQESTPRRSYYYFSRSSLPEGTAILTRAKGTSQSQKSKESPIDKTRLASWERDELLLAEPNIVVGPQPEQEWAPGMPIDRPLVGTRSSYDWLGHRYSAHCLTAPGFEGACRRPCPPELEYRLRVRPPGLISCLLGCHDFRYKWVAVRPRWRGDWLANRYRTRWSHAGRCDFLKEDLGGLPLGGETLAFSESAAVWSPGRVYGVSPTGPLGATPGEYSAPGMPPAGLGATDWTPEAGVGAEDFPGPLLTPPSP